MASPLSIRLGLRLALLLRETQHNTTASPAPTPFGSRPLPPSTVAAPVATAVPEEEESTLRWISSTAAPGLFFQIN